MRIETLSVREAREQLPSMLEGFRRGSRTPIGVGPHRKTEAVMVPIDVYDELVAGRSRYVSEAIGSLRAEDLSPSVEAQEIAERWSRGEISAAQMRALILQLHDVQ